MTLWQTVSLLLLAATAASAGCAPHAAASTRLTESDFDAAVAEVTASLASSSFLAERTPDSPQVRIVTRHVENLTSDVISAAEQWMLVVRVQDALPIRQMSERKNIVFQIPPERVAELRQRGFELPMIEENQPTHTMSAVFRSSTRAGRERAGGYADIRKDYYLMEYVITDLRNRRQEWSGSFELREAVGLAID